MKPKEIWKDNFRNVCMFDRSFGGQNEKMCTRWHIRGGCFKDCKNRASHVGKDKIPGNKKEGLKSTLRKSGGPEIPGWGLAASDPAERPLESWTK